MSCIVAYIEWYHEMDNGTEKLIKVRRGREKYHCLTPVSSTIATAFRGFAMHIWGRERGDKPVAVSSSPDGKGNA